LTKLSHSLTSRLYLLGWAVVCRLPETWARGLFAAIADALWWAHGRGVRQLEANLARVLGPDAPPDRTRQVSRLGMRSYLRYWLEVFRLPVIPADQIMSRTRLYGGLDQAALDHLAAGRGVIFALPHMGNYELAGAWIIRRGAGPLTTVAERLNADRVYQRFIRLREGLGMEVLPHAGANAFGQMARRLRQGRLVCLVCDRDLTAHGVEVEFFGETARMANVPATLAVQTGAALIPATLWFEGEYWAIRVYPEIAVPPGASRPDKIALMSQRLADAFEEGIREHPESWHMLQKVFTADLDPQAWPGRTPAASGRSRAWSRRRARRSPGADFGAGQLT
jgi:phosphatidylinositol dimannoside acyltransferase